MRTATIYARVSSIGDRQSTERQVRDLTSFAASNGLQLVHNAFTEHISGATKNSDRAVLCECLDYCFSNSIDCLLVSELSRLGRSTWEVLENVKRCRDNHLNVIFQKEGLSIFNNDGTESFTLPVIISCLGMAAQMERENIKFRLNSGRDKFIAEGGKLGRKEGYRMSKEAYQKKYGDLIQKLTERKRHLEAGLRDKSHCRRFRGVRGHRPDDTKGVQLVRLHFFADFGVLSGRKSLETPLFMGFSGCDTIFERISIPPIYKYNRQTFCVKRVKSRFLTDFSFSLSILLRLVEVSGFSSLYFRFRL